MRLLHWGSCTGPDSGRKCCARPTSSPTQRRAIAVVGPHAPSLRNRQPTTQPSPSRFFLRTILPAPKEANVLRFVDFALSEIEPQNKADFTKALKALNERAKKTNPEATSF